MHLVLNSCRRRPRDKTRRDASTKRESRFKTMHYNVSPKFPKLDLTTDAEYVAFRVRRSRGEMYSGNGSLCVCLSAPRRIPTVLHGTGCYLGNGV